MVHVVERGAQNTRSLGTDEATSKPKQMGVKRRNYLIAGSIAGSVPAILLHPLDLVKIRYQANDTSAKPYRSVRHAFSDIVKVEGWRALFQGLSPALLGNCVSTGLYFYFYEHAKQRYGVASNHTKHDRLKPHQHLAAAAEAGVTCVMITNPIWLIKTRMQLQRKPLALLSNERPYTSFLDAGSRIIQEEGFLALYRGIVPALLLVSHGATKFAAYEQMKTFYMRRDEKLGHWHHFLMGGSSHIFASTLTYPFQVVRTRLQQRMPPLSSATATAAEGVAVAVAPKYSGTIDCVMKTWSKEGVRGFYKGLVPNVLRVAPNSALMFVTYEYVLPLLVGR